MTSLPSTTGRPLRGSPAAGAVRLTPAGPSLWRAIAPTGRIIGHVRQWQHPSGTRFRALRYSPVARAFRELGDFWSAEDAVTCLAYTR